MPTITSKQVVGEFADAAVAAFETQKPAVEALIASGEVKLEEAVANVLKNLPKPSGIQGALVAPLEAAFESAALAYAQTVVAKYGADALYTLLDVQLHVWAKQLGG